MPRKKGEVPAQSHGEDLPEFDFSQAVFAKNVSPKKVSWEWKNRIRAFALNCLDGDPGVGKSSLVTALAATISRGGKFGKDPGLASPGRTLWITGEETFDTDVVPRWIACNGQMKDLVHWPNSTLDRSERIELPHDVFKLTALLRHLEARVLVLDTFTSLLSPGQDNVGESQLRAYLEALFAATAPAGVSVLMTRHWIKSQMASALHRGLGSIAMSAVCRTISAVTLDPETGEPGIWSPVKTSNGEKIKGIGFQILKTAKGVPFVSWGELHDNNIADIMQLNAQGGEEDAFNDAEMILIKILKNGPMRVEEIRKQYVKDGISDSTARRAKRKLKVTSKRISIGSKGDGYSLWVPPAVFPPPRKKK